MNSGATTSDTPPAGHSRHDSGGSTVHVTKFAHSGPAQGALPLLTRPSQPSPNRGASNVSLKQRTPSPSTGEEPLSAASQSAKSNSHHKDASHSSATRNDSGEGSTSANAKTGSANANANANANAVEAPSASSINHADQLMERVVAALRVNSNAEATSQDETNLLESFHSLFHAHRSFAQLPPVVQKSVVEFFQLLVRNRLLSIGWLEKASLRYILAMLCCMRVLLRDTQFLNLLLNHQEATPTLCTYLEKLTAAYLAKNEEEDDMVPKILTELINIFHRLSMTTTRGSEQRTQALLQAGIQKSLLQLLAANNLHILQTTMKVLSNLAQHKQFRAAFTELDFVDTVLRILQDYDEQSKILAAVFLRTMLLEPRSKYWVKFYDGIPIILSLLHSECIELLLQLIWCVVLLANDPEGSQEVGDIGGIPILLSLLHDRDRSLLSEEADQASSSNSSSNNAALFSAQQHHKDSTSSSPPQTADELALFQQSLSLKCSTCTALAELLINDVNDSNAHHLVRNNGIYLMSLLIFPAPPGGGLEPVSPTSPVSCNSPASTGLSQEESDIGQLSFVLQCSAIRIIRVLFSLERNRRYFKKLFPPNLYGTFIDIGHYVREITSYYELVRQINALSKEQQEQIRAEVQNLNHNREATHQMNDYSVYELLGQGAFGSVFKVKKHTGGSFLAMKEIHINSVIGKTSMKEREKTVCDIISELTIIREQLRHPNVVRYYKTFLESDKIYIVMEYIEGAPLAEYFTSFKEKNLRFEEERIWRVFVQIVLALRYLHKDKRIVHRDLTPNNIMLGDEDKVTITDFGLAKQKNKETSKLVSVVGTILYWCPELVQSMPYGEKADVWAAGCILYQLATLQPPFYHTNLLTLGKKIAEADYAPIDEKYSEKIRNVVTACLTVTADDRPDIVGVASLIADVVLRQMDTLKVQNAVVQKRLERERRRAQKNVKDSNRQNSDMCTVCSCTLQRVLASESTLLFQPPSLNSSAGASNMRDDVSLSATSCGIHSLNSASVSGKPPLMPSNSRVGGTRRSGSSNKESRRSESTAEQLRVEIPAGSQSPASKLPPGATSSVNRSVSPANGSAAGANVASTSLANSSSSSSIYLSKMFRSRSSSNVDAPMLTISSKRVRQIHDPVLEILRIAQKLVYITQLPPSVEPTFNARRRVIERYKRALFAAPTRPTDLKSELHKLMMGVCEPIELNLGADVQLLLAASEKADEGVSMLNRAAVLEHDAKTINVNTLASAEFDADVHNQLTYEQLLSMIDATLRESAYYEQSGSVQRGVSQKAASNRARNYNGSSQSLSGSSNDGHWMAPPNGHSNGNPSPLASATTSGNATGHHAKQKASGASAPRS